MLVHIYSIVYCIFFMGGWGGGWGVGGGRCQYSELNLKQKLGVKLSGLKGHYMMTRCSFARYIYCIDQLCLYSFPKIVY